MRVAARSILVNGKFDAIIDTNTIVAMWHKLGNVQDMLEQVDYGYLPIQVVGELYYGARHSARPNEGIERIRVLLGRSNTITTASIYGDVKAKLRGSGTLIPESDIWIASCALRWELPVVTRDEHFHKVEGLKIVPWGIPTST